MADTGSVKLEMGYEVGGTSSTASILSNFTEQATVPTKDFRGSRLCATGGTALIAASQFTTVQRLGLENTDTSNYVTVTWTSVLGSVASIMVIGPGATALIPNIVNTTAVTVTANTAACIVKYFGLCT